MYILVTSNLPFSVDPPDRTKVICQTACSKIQLATNPPRTFSSGCADTSQRSHRLAKKNCQMAERIGQIAEKNSAIYLKYYIRTYTYNAISLPNAKCSCMQIIALQTIWDRVQMCCGQGQTFYGLVTDVSH